MKKLEIILWILLIIGLTLGFIYFKKSMSELDSINKNNDKLMNDLKLIIHNRDSLINKYKEDSIKYSNKKAQIIIKYEKAKQDFSNPIIISDDSITKYISSKLHN